MKLIRVAAAVLNQTPLAWDANRDHVVAAIREARRQGASVLCLPELCLTGYGCEDEFHSRGLQQTALRVLEEVLPETRGMVVSLGLPFMHQHALFNAAALCVDGRVRGLVCKRFLAGDGIHYEPRWFKPWPHGHRATVELAGASVPIGDIHFDVGGVKLGFEICEDAWAAARPGGALAQAGVDVILNPSASHFAFGKHEVRQRFVLEGSRAFGVTYVYANLLGNEAGRAIYDGGALIGSGGHLCAAGPRFSYAAQIVTSAVVDVDATRMALARTQSFRPRLEERPSECVHADFAYPELEPAEATPELASWERSPSLKEEEFTRAIALGLFDYLRKSRSDGFVVSLSGGADSSGVACLVAAAVGFGVAELGLAGFRAKLAHASGAQGAGGVRELVHALLLCVYQGTENSTATTRDAARAVAEGLGADFLLLDVDRQVKGYVELVSGAVGRPLNWAHDDVALQNIQARTRGPAVGLLANLRNALLLATSNRSEAAVGYATMDGDTCGGLSPIAGIDKAFLRRWLRWLELQGPDGLAPLPALAAVTAQAPTAELRPAAAHQTDEDDLMPYDVLDAVERAAIRDKHTPVEVFRHMRARFAAVPAAQMLLWVERFFRLWCRNQWKRERYAPSFHVDDENLDPKTWCRFPIL
ncbi:MAG: NAD(+) synthase, partial [Deltaproteobacteria bacterium]|nr:NAD(+) synthase [Deltaproteobacteria bacterium]